MGATKNAERADRFSANYEQQSPDYLWIGFAADSRVPANDLIGLQPGEVFVHRNIANIIVPSDLNCLSVLQYAVGCTKVKTRHHLRPLRLWRVAAAFHNRRVGLVDNRLRHIHDVPNGRNTPCSAPQRINLPESFMRAP